jgi:hypoxanthine phosphoribosyltransferase
VTEVKPGETSTSETPAVEPGDDASLVQQAFPALWRYVRPADDRQFAHPAERNFATILSFYRVRWSYEPTSFPIEWAEDGRPVELFTPDFYLPDLRLYIELTTMRQRLVTRKNRKLRRLRSLYPNIRIKLLYRRDYHQFVDLYLRRTGDVSHSAPGKRLLTSEDIACRIDALADEIVSNTVGEHRDDKLLIVVASRGAERFAGELGTALTSRGVDPEWDAVSISRSRSGENGGRVRLNRRPAVDPRGRRVLVVTDVVHTGFSIAFLLRWLSARGARTVDLCTFLDRASARLVDVPIRYRAFDAPNELVTGFGLRLRPAYSELDGIHHLISLHPDGTTGTADS